MSDQKSLREAELEAQLAESQELLREETRQKLTAQSELAALQVKFDALEIDHFALRAQVSDQNREAETRAEQSMEEPKRKKPKNVEDVSEFKSKYAVYRIMEADKSHIYFGKMTTFGVQNIREIVHCAEALGVWQISNGKRTSKHDTIEAALKGDGLCFARLAFENEEDAYYVELCLIEAAEGTNSASGILREKFRGTSPEQIAEDGKYYLERFDELIANSELPIYTQHNYKEYKPEVMLEQCAKCKEFEPLRGNGICKSCDHESKRVENTGFCTDPNCPKKGEKIVFSSKYSTVCQTCYQRNYRSKSKGKCSECKLDIYQICNKKFMVCGGCINKWRKDHPELVQKRKKRK